MCVCHARSLGNAVNRRNRCAVHQKRACAAESMTVLIWSPEHLGINMYCTTTGTYSYSQWTQGQEEPFALSMTASTFARLADSFLATHLVPLSTALPHSWKEAKKVLSGIRLLPLL